MLPDYWRDRPPLSVDGSTQAAIEELLGREIWAMFYAIVDAIATG